MRIIEEKKNLETQLIEEKETYRTSMIQAESYKLECEKKENSLKKCQTDFETMKKTSEDDRKQFVNAANNLQNIINHIQPQIASLLEEKKKIAEDQNKKESEHKIKYQKICSQLIKKKNLVLNRLKLNFEKKARSIRWIKRFKDITYPTKESFDLYVAKYMKAKLAGQKMPNPKVIKDVELNITALNCEEELKKLQEKIDNEKKKSKAQTEELNKVKSQMPPFPEYMKEQGITIESYEKIMYFHSQTYI